jgi:hypothetical protein
MFCPIAQLEGETIVGKSDCFPECDAGLVRAQYIDRNALVFRPHLREQNLHTLPANAGTSLVALNEELTQVNVIFLVAIQGVCDNIGVIRKDRGPIISR